jgi:hypothetical protein
MLEQRVCTVALRDTVPMETSTSITAFYRTALPETVSAELHKVASFNDVNPKHTPGAPDTQSRSGEQATRRQAKRRIG